MSSVQLVFEEETKERGLRWRELLVYRENLFESITDDFEAREGAV